MRPGSRAVMLALAASLVGGAGCLLTSDFGGIVGVRPAEGEGEGGAADGASTEDAGGAAGACTGEEHTFCTDFDDITEPPVPGWQVVQRGGGTVTLDRASAVTEPHSIGMSISGGESPAAFLLRDVALGSFKTVTLGFDFRLVDCPAQVENSLTFVYLGVGTGTAYGFVILSSGSLALGSAVGTDNAFFPLETLVQPGEWARIVVTLTAKTATELHLGLTVNGAASVDTDAPTGPPKSTLQIELGAQGVAAPKGCQVAYDNVVLDKE